MFSRVSLFIFLGGIPRRIIAQNGNSALSASGVPDCFPKQLYHFMLSASRYEDCEFSASLQIIWHYLFLVDILVDVTTMRPWSFFIVVRYI